MMKTELYSVWEENKHTERVQRHLCKQGLMNGDYCFGEAIF